MTGNPQDHASSPNSLASRVYRRNRNVSFTLFGEEGLLVVPTDSWNLVLNGPGARAFELFDGQRTVRMVAQIVFEEYGAASLTAVEADVAEMVCDLSTRGALEEVLT